MAAVFAFVLLPATQVPATLASPYSADIETEIDIAETCVAYLGLLIFPCPPIVLIAAWGSGGFRAGNGTCLTAFFLMRLVSMLGLKPNLDFLLELKVRGVRALHSLETGLSALSEVLELHLLAPRQVYPRRFVLLGKRCQASPVFNPDLGPADCLSFSYRNDY